MDGGAAGLKCVVAVFAYAGVRIAGMMLIGWLTASMFAVVVSFRFDLCLQE